MWGVAFTACVVFSFSFLFLLHRSRGDSNRTTLKKDWKLKDKMAARGAGCTKKGG
jgi:hypothetical protein